MKEFEKISLLVTFLILVFAMIACNDNSYPTVKIGDQVWMAKNMNLETENSWCYDNLPQNCEKYGRLYTWDAAKKVCPSGWHLPSKEEFEKLLANVGETPEEWGNNLRAKDWENGLDKNGFSALPAGRYHSDFKTFVGLGYYARFWSSTGFGAEFAFLLYVDAYARLDGNDKAYVFSVRCIKDSN